MPHETETRAELIERLKWKKFPVLDDGFVCLVDVMGEDSSVTQAAQVSYGAGTKKISSDRDLIRYLMRHRHGTPFEMAEIKLLVRVPMDIWRQWIRHRAASTNEYSTRYSLAIDSMHETDETEWRLQSKDNKQGSDGFALLDDGKLLSEEEQQLHDHALQVYRTRIAKGVAREQARKDLPLSTYTEAYWKVDLRNMFHFLSLRMESHAQLEIRRYAGTIGEEIVKPLFPHAWQAFCDYDLNATSLSRMERAAIGAILRSEEPDLSELSKREVSEFWAKIDAMKGM